MILSANGLKMSFGDNSLFRDVSFGVERNDKIGIIGSNGCGKTTLFNILLGKLSSEEGGVVRSAGLNIGYLQQHACRDSSRTAYREAVSVFDDLINEETRLEKLSKELETSHSETVIAEYSALNEHFIGNGGLTYRSRTTAALKGLGFSDDEINLPVSSLSGGQRSKLELCRLLLSAPDLMLLDEPTNHLDIESVKWLEDYISSFKGAAMIISHDRYFLDRVTNRTFSFENRRLYIVNGNYSKFREVRELQKQTELKEYENTMREVRRIEGIIEQQRRWNKEKNIKTAESKEKQIERLVKDLKKPESEETPIAPTFPVKCETGNDCLFAEGLSAAFGDRVLYKNVCLDIKIRERVFLIGSNGCGKTTLMKQLLSSPKVKFGAGVITGYFDQHGEGVRSDRSAFGELRDSFPAIGDTELRSALAAYGFRGDEVFEKIGDMSGGERAKVLLCKLGLKKANFLFLDEPTNHLDLPSREALEAALKEYRGTLFVISHDRYFINSLATRIVRLTENGIESFSGNYDDYMNAIAPPAADCGSESGNAGGAAVGTGNGNCTRKNTGGQGGPPTDSVSYDRKTEERRPEAPISKNKAEYLKRKADASKMRTLRTEIGKTEAEISYLESRTAELNGMLMNEETASDYLKVAELTEELETVNNRLEELTEHWAELTIRLEEAEGKQ